MSRKKPKFLGEEYDITLVQARPPGPPEYELVNAWPHAPRNTRHAQGSKAPIIISLIALIIAILSMYCSLLNPYLLQSSLNVTATTTITTTSTYISTSITTAITKITTTIPTTETTTITIVKSISLSILPHDIAECIEFRQNARIANFTFSKYNGTHGLLSLEIDFTSTVNYVTESNFSVNLSKDYKLELNKLREPDTYQVSVYHRLEESDITVYLKSNETQQCPIVRIFLKID